MKPKREIIKVGDDRLGHDMAYIGDLEFFDKVIMPKLRKEK